MKLSRLLTRMLFFPGVIACCTVGAQETKSAPPDFSLIGKDVKNIVMKNAGAGQGPFTVKNK